MLPSRLPALPSLRPSYVPTSDPSDARSSALPTLRPFLPAPPSRPAALATMVLRVPDRMRSVGGPRTLVDANWSEAGRLEHAHELQSDHFEQREKRDNQPAAV